MPAQDPYQFPLRNISTLASHSREEDNNWKSARFQLISTLPPSATESPEETKTLSYQGGEDMKNYF